MFEKSKVDNRDSGTFDLRLGPDKISTEMDNRLGAILALAYASESPGAIDSVFFNMPGGSHLLTLFENKLFTQLVETHNRRDTGIRSVSPVTLMWVDPDLPKIFDDTGILRGETVSEHELGHEYANQESTNYMATVARPNIAYHFAWVQVDRGLRFIVHADYNKYNELYDVRQAINVLLGPRYPSASDRSTNLKVIEKIAEETGQSPEMLMRIVKAADDLRAKEYQAEYPPETTEVTLKLFNNWKKHRQGMINFPPGWEPRTI